jgi:hypothetical protein
MSPSEKLPRELREQAVKTVIETSRPIAQVARELGLNPGTLGNWVRAWRKEHTGVSASGGLAASLLPMDSANSVLGAAADSSSADDFDLGVGTPSDRSGSMTTSVVRVSSHRVRLGTWITLAANAFLYLTVGNLVSYFFIGLAAEVALAAVLSQAARESLHSSLGSLLLIAGLAICLEISGYLYTKSAINGRVGRIVLGKPSFGRLGGVREVDLRLVMQMHKQFSMEVAPEEKETISSIRALNLEISEAVLRAKYTRERELDGVTVDHANREWTETQWPRILSYSCDGVSLEDTYSNSLVWQVFFPRISQILRRVMPLIFIGLTVGIWLFAREIRAGDYLLTLQLVLLTGFLLTAIVFANITYGLSFVQWTAPNNASLNAIPDKELRSRVAAAPWIGKRFWPVKVTFGNRYTPLVGNYFARRAVAPLCYWTVALLCVLLICAAVGTIGSGGPESEWYYHMAVALVAIPALIFLAIYVSFVILRMAGGLTAIVTAALILAITPPMLTFLFTGQQPGKGAVSTSLIAGLAGALATAIADRTKDRVERSRH